MMDAVERFRDQVRGAARRAVAETALALAEKAAEMTPVKTGRLRGSWQVVESEDQAEPLPPAVGGVYVRVDLEPPPPRRRLLVVNPLNYAAPVEFGALGRPGAHMAQEAVSSLKGQLGRTFLDLLKKGTSPAADK